MKKLSLLSLLILALAVTLTACGGGDDESAEVDESILQIGDPEHGEELFNSQVLAGSTAGCVTCHSLEPGVTIVGPSQSDVGFRASQRVSGMSAEAYLRESLVEPDAYVVDGFTAGTMTQNLAEALSDEDINDLIAYMLTLKG